MLIPFVKMHGAGNDFVMIDNREGLFPGYNLYQITRIAQRPTGFGCEGVIFVERTTEPSADFAMRFFNPDGSEAELCGNGARCVAVFARQIGVAKADQMRFVSKAGIVSAEILPKGLVKIGMPPPKDLRTNFVNTGVPHAIVPVKGIKSVDVEKEGRTIRYSPEFAPAGTNVDFIMGVDQHNAFIRTYERGVEAESGACGTGAVAAALIGVAQYEMQFPVTLTTRMGYKLTVDGTCENGVFSDVTLTGPVATTFSGTYQVND